jgi:FdhE protein
LAETEKQEGKLPLLLGFYRDLLKVQTGIRESIKVMPAVKENGDIKTRLAAGQPLITFDELRIEPEIENRSYREVISVFAEYPQLFDEFSEAIKDSGADWLQEVEAAKMWYSGTQLPESPVKNTGKSNGMLLQAIVQAAVRPFLVNRVMAVNESMDGKNIESWHREYCPFCGGKADMAYLEKTVGARWLVCSRCDSSWPFLRLRCPYCLNQDQKELGFFMDSTEQYRLQVCDKCKCYIKTVDLRKSSYEVLMPLERIFTVEMDRQAREKGYHSC